MTRDQFLDEVNSFDDLRCFCGEIDCDICSDIYTEDEMDDAIDDRDLVDWAQNYRWYELRDMLDNIPTGYSYYAYNDYDCEWTGLMDEDFERYKQDVLEWADEEMVWDEEEDEEDPDSQAEDEDEEPDDGAFEPDFSINELLNESINIVRIVDEKNKREQEERRAAEIAEAEEMEAQFKEFFKFV